MRELIVFLILFQTGVPSPAPTPVTVTGQTYTVSLNAEPLKSTHITFVSTDMTPRMVIYFSGDKILQINSPDGKHLAVGADGKVTGDMPHDKAADEFWKAMARAFPQQCGERPRGGSQSE